MQIIHDIYDRVISIENILACWYEFKKGKTNRLDVMIFDRHLEDNIFLLHEELGSKTYKHDSYDTFHIYDPKHRIISRATVKDRLVHHIVFNELYRIFDPTFIYHSYASRLHHGTHLAVKNVSCSLRKVSKNYTQRAYVLKCDIKKFFDSVSHQKLLQLIQKRINDSQSLWLIREVIESFPLSTVDNSAERERVKGLPIGNLTSQIFANIYLNELDQFVKHTLKVRYYFRYADDFLLVHADPDYLQLLLGHISDFLKKYLLLELHPQKVEIRKFHQGIDFLGYVIMPHHITLRTKTKRRMFKKLFEKQELLLNNAIDESTFHQSIQSYIGLIGHANGYNLKQVVQNIFYTIH